MPQPALANPDHVGVRGEDGGEEDPILESLWSSGSASETFAKPAAGKRQRFSDLNRSAKRRVGDLFQTAYSASDEGKPDPDAAEVDLSLQYALSRVNPAFREMLTKIINANPRKRSHAHPTHSNTLKHTRTRPQALASTSHTMQTARTHENVTSQTPAQPHTC
jgi:hypothetical protein